MENLSRVFNFIIGGSWFAFLTLENVDLFLRIIASCFVITWYIIQLLKKKK